MNKKKNNRRKTAIERLHIDVTTSLTTFGNVHSTSVIFGTKSNKLSDDRNLSYQLSHAYDHFLMRHLPVVSRTGRTAVPAFSDEGL